MNIKVLGLHIVLLHACSYGVQLGVNNESSKRVKIEFSFLLEKASGMAKIIHGKFTSSPGKFYLWQEELPEEEKIVHKVYLTSCTINGKDTSFGRSFEGDAWYIDVHSRNGATYASLVKYLDCYLEEKKCAGGLPGLQNLAQLLSVQTDPELVHSLRRRTQLFLKFP